MSSSNSQHPHGPPPPRQAALYPIPQQAPLMVPQPPPRRQGSFYPLLEQGTQVPLRSLQRQQASLHPLPEQSQQAIQRPRPTQANLYPLPPSAAKDTSPPLRSPVNDSWELIDSYGNADYDYLPPHIATPPHQLPQIQIQPGRSEGGVDDRSGSADIHVRGNQRIRRFKAQNYQKEMLRQERVRAGLSPPHFPRPKPTAPPTLHPSLPGKPTITDELLDRPWDLGTPLLGLPANPVTGVVPSGPHVTKARGFGRLVQPQLEDGRADGPGLWAKRPAVGHRRTEQPNQRYLDAQPRLVNIMNLPAPIRAREPLHHPSPRSSTSGPHRGQTNTPITHAVPQQSSYQGEAARGRSQLEEGIGALNDGAVGDEYRRKHRSQAELMQERHIIYTSPINQPGPSYNPLLDLPHPLASTPPPLQDPTTRFAPLPLGTARLTNRQQGKFKRPRHDPTRGKRNFDPRRRGVEEHPRLSGVSALADRDRRRVDSPVIRQLSSGRGGGGGALREVGGGSKSAELWKALNPTQTLFMKRLFGLPAGGGLVGGGYERGSQSILGNIAPRAQNLDQRDEGRSAGSGSQVDQAGMGRMGGWMMVGPMSGFVPNQESRRQDYGDRLSQQGSRYNHPGQATVYEREQPTVSPASSQPKLQRPPVPDSYLISDYGSPAPRASASRYPELGATMYSRIGQDMALRDSGESATGVREDSVRMEGVRLGEACAETGEGFDFADGELGDGREEGGERGEGCENEEENEESSG